MISEKKMQRPRGKAKNAKNKVEKQMQIRPGTN
jgi:hypothetical protein